MSQVAEFKVAHLYPPYQGKGLAKIVAHDGTKYSCQESQLAQFREGEDVAIHYTDESFASKKTGENVTFKKFVSKIAKTNGQAPKQFNRPSTSSRDAEHIFVTATLKEFIANGMVANDMDSIVACIGKLRAAYARTLGGVQSQSRDDLDDQIPF